MSTHVLRSRQAWGSCLHEGGGTRKVGKGPFSSVCDKYTYTGPSAASKAWDATWSFPGAQPWQPSLGRQVVPPASTLATVLSWVPTSTHSYQESVLFFFTTLFIKLGFVLGSVVVPTDGRTDRREGWMGKGAEERRKADEGKKLV